MIWVLTIVEIVILATMNMIGLFAGLVLGILGESDLDVLYFQINPTSQIRA